MTDLSRIQHDQPRLAISNSKRKVLPGCQFLDHVISSRMTSEVTAIDHLDSERCNFKLTYRHLSQISDLLASRIRRWLGGNSNRNSIIPVVIPQHPALYTSYLAILKTGAAFCPVTPDTPDERLRFIIEDVGAKVVLCLPDLQDHIQHVLPSIAVRPVNLQGLLENVRGASTDSSPTTQAEIGVRKPSDTAYVMYTSGSTGKPKGVPISHHAVVQSLLAHEEHIPSFDRFLQFASPTFDVSIFEIFFPWFRGSTVVSCHRELMLTDLPAIINTQNIDAVELTPTVATALLRTRSVAPQLKLVLTIGEMLTPYVVQEFGGSDTRDSILFAMYGPTEAAIHCTILPRMTVSTPAHNIGQPLSTVTAFILQETDSSQVPEIIRVDQVGELAVAGQLADGYLNRSDQTTVAFIQLPGYGKVYRTGDRALMAADGSIHILGRISAGQVKLRGQRVELGEIEEVACQTSGLELAIAMVIDETLVLFCSGVEALQTKDIEQKCKAWLPRHMRPSQIIITKTGMPRLPSGKIDRKALESTFASSSANQVETIPQPQSRTEEILLAAFAGALHTSVSRDKSLWICGLDSLRAIRIASDLRNNFPTISVPLILEADTIADLAVRLDAVDCQEDPVVSNEIFENSTQWHTMKQTILSERHDMLEGMDIEGIYPCSAMQMAMLSETLRDPNQNVNEIVLNFCPTISFLSVVEAFEAIAQKNAILRTGFMSTDDAEMPFVQITTRSSSLRGDFSILEPLKLMRSDDYRVVVKLHHAIYDGWSWDLIMLDINTMLRGGTPLDRPSYREFNQKKQEQMITHGDSDLTAWVDYLHEAEPTEFPSITSTTCSTAARGEVTTKLSVSFSDISNVARNVGASCPALLHAALALLLSPYLDTKNIMTGLVTAGREALLPSVKDVIGPCFSTMPTIVRLDGLQTVRDLVKHVHQQHLHCLRHSNVTPAQVQAALRQSNGNKLFDVLYVWQQSLESGSDVEPLIWTVETHDILVYALVVEVEPVRECLCVKTTFDERRLSREQMELVHDQLDSIVRVMTTHLDEIVSNIWSYLSIPMLSASNMDVARPKLIDLTSSVAKHAREEPEKIAIDFVQDFDPLTKSTVHETLSYKQLHHRSRHIAVRLRERYAVRRNDIVAVWAMKSIELYVIICGIVTAGCGYLCIDPNSPESRVKEILLEASCDILISDVSLDEDIFGQTIISITDLSGNLSELLTDLNINPEAHDLAYAVFTSGSTGVPKGVLITRENLMSNIDHLARIYPHTTSSRLLQSCSTAFDVSVFEIFWTWHCGMTLCSANNDVLFRDLEALVDALGITHLSMTPSVAALVDPYKVPQVQFLVCAGEPMSAKVFETWADHGLHQGYGPSETTNICNVRSYTAGKAPINNVGPPFLNTSLFICSRLASGRTSKPLELADFQLIPRGGIGEIWIGGAQVGLGYTDAALTAQSWLDHPKFGRLYRSGDIGRLLADDSVVILGREDDQTKIRGQRIELNEITSKLMHSHHVSNAVALILKDATNRDRLVAFWVLDNVDHEDTKGIIDALFDHLRDALPQYMVPELLIPTPSIPVTRQGKVDKRKLAEIHGSLTKDETIRLSSTLSSDDEGPVGTVEEAQAINILSTFSGIPTADINPHASFFSYGVDSIKAIALANKFRDGGIDAVDVSSIMRYPSLRRLLSHAQKQKEVVQSRDAGFDFRKAVPKELRRTVATQFEAQGLIVKHIVPCTPLQEAMLSSSESSPNKSYFNHVVYHIHTNMQIMKEAWSTMIERHQILRTTFMLTNDPDYPYLQAILTAVKLPWVDTKHPSADLVPSDIGQPLYQLQAINQNSRSTELHLLIHHALYDADSLGHLQHEVELFCRGTQLPRAIPFVRYLQFMVNVDSSKCNNFWRTTMNNVTPCRLKRIVDGKNVRKSHMSTASRVCPISFSQLQRAIRKLSSTLLAVLQATLARLLSCYLRTSDVCFGTVFGGRNISVDGVDTIVGPCFNTLPTCAQLQHSTTNKKLVGLFQTFNADVLPFQSSSLRQLQREYSPDGQLLFDMLLLLQPPLTDLDDKVWQFARDEGHMDFPFILEATHNSREDRLHFKLHTNFCDDAQFLQTFLEQFSILLEDTVTRPFAHALDVNQVKAPVLNEQTNGNATHPLGNGTHHQAGQVPNATAVPLQTVIDSMVGLTKRNLRNISYNTSIFQLGLDSISVVQLASTLRSQGIAISTADILDNPQIGEIAKFCKKDSHHDARQTPQKLDLEAFELQHRQKIVGHVQCNDKDIEAVWPCTSTQIGILSENLRTDGHLYYNTMQLTLNCDVDVSKLKAAFDLAMRKHVMLRTGFVEITDIECPFAMVVYMPESVALPWHDLSPGEHNSNANDLRSESLAQPPWWIEVQREEEATILCLHVLHSLYDGQSIQIVLSDVVAAYRGDSLPDPAPVSRALDIIITQNRMPIEDEGFFGKLKDEIHSTKFPDLNICREVPSKLDVFTARTRHMVSELQAHCEALDITLLTACQIAWAQLLAAYCGQQSVTFGTTLSGRDSQRGELHHVAFPCFNTLPVVVDVSLPEEELVATVKKFNVGLFRNQHVPLPKIKKLWRVDGNLFDSLLVLQKYDRHSSYTAPWQLRSEQASAEYAVSLEIVDSDDVLDLQLTYDERCIPAEHSRLLLRQFEYLLYRVVKIDTKDARSQSNMVAALPPKDLMIPSKFQTLHEMALDTADRYPQRVALEFITSIEDGVTSKKEWTYSDLKARACMVAHLLLQHGAKVGDLIAICFEKCPEASYALLGILMTGCAYVAIDPGAPASRKEFILKDARCKLVLTTASTVGFFEDIDTAKVCVLDEARLSESSDMSAPLFTSSVSGDDVCYCLYTSGTTGEPKGCLITHKSASQAMCSFSRIFDGHWTSESRWLQFASYHFDVSVLEHFWSWNEGIRVAVAPRDLLFEDLPGAINELGITHLALTPSLGRLLTPENVPSLRDGVFIVGGEQVPQDIISVWGDAGCLYNFYGPSEVTIGCTVHPRVRKNVKPTNIGQQWDNVGSYILQPHSEEPTLIGAVGELCLSGVLVGKGYLNKPELTAEKFVTLGVDNERVYRTGDLVRMLHDHSFEFLARIDDQVKLRGQRLEIGEINHVLLEGATEVKDVATLVLRHPEQQQEHLVSFLAQRKGTRSKSSNPTIDSENASFGLISTARKRAVVHLPMYMVPTYFIPVDFLPLTANNKVDAKALRGLYAATPISVIREQQSLHASESQIQHEELEEFIQLIASFLGMNSQQIDRAASLFQLGVESIAAIGLSRHLKQAGYASASVATILKHPVVADLAGALIFNKETNTSRQDMDYQQSMEHITDFTTKYRGVIEKAWASKGRVAKHIAPCTPLQAGMISKLLSSPGRVPLYLTKLIYRLQDEVEIDKLQGAWNDLQASLDILRTYFMATDDGYAEVVLQESSDTVHIDYGTKFTRESALDQIDDRFKKWCDQARHLEHVLPWQVWLTQTGGGPKYMSMFMFHGIYDGNSIPLLLNALHKRYLGINHEDNQTMQFHQALSRGPLLTRKDAPDFWRRQLPRVRLLNLPPQHNTKVPMETKSIHCELVFDDIGDMASYMDVTPPAIVHAAWLYTLAKCFAINPTIGVVLSGRSIDVEDASQIVGPMFNTLPVMVDSIREDASLADLVVTCHAKTIEVLPYQHSSLSDIKKWTKLNHERELFDFLFVYQDSRELTNQTCQWPWNEQQLDSIADYPLNIEVERVEDGKLSINIVMLTASNEADIMHDLMDTFVDTIRQMENSKMLPLPNCFRNDGMDQVQSQAKELPRIIDTNRKQQAFTWSSEAELIRTELASLAQVDESSIRHDRPTIFELGLDSIDALKLAARLRSKGIKLPVSKILQHPNVQGMFGQWITLVDLQPSDRTSVLTQEQARLRAILPYDEDFLDTIEVITPTTPLQEGLLLSFEEYFHIFTYRLGDDIDIGRLVNAINQTIYDLPVLRTSFSSIEAPNEDIHFVQLVHKPGAQGLQARDWSEFESVAALEENVRALKEDACMENSVPQLSIAAVNKVGMFLVLGMSHASYDAWSLKLLHNHIHDHYHGKNSPAQSAVAITEYVHDIRETGKQQSTVDFWSKQLDSILPTLVPISNQIGHVAILKTITSDVLAEDAYSSCKQSGITMQSLGLAAWALTLMTTTGQLDVNFGLVMSGRTSEEAQTLAFPTFNTIIFRPNLETSLSKQQLVRQIHDLAAGIYEHQHLPLPKALRLAGENEANLFNTLFTFQKTPDSSSTTQQLYNEIEIEHGLVSPPYAVNVELEEKSGDLVWTVAVQNGVMSAADVQNVLKRVDHIFAFLVRHQTTAVFENNDRGQKTSICGLDPIDLPKAYRPDSRTPSTVPGEPTMSDGHWSKLEIQIKDVFSKVSGVDITEIHRDTSLFNLGLDSISAIKISNFLRRAGSGIPVSRILKGQTIRQIAVLATQKVNLLEDRRPPHGTTTGLTAPFEKLLHDAGINLEDIEDVLPATAGQSCMLDIWQASDKSLFYAEFWFEVSNCVESRFVEAFRELVKQVPVLRTSFLHGEAGYYQVVYRDNSNVQNEFSGQYKLTCDGNNLHVALRLHHALYDAVSLQLMVQEIQRLIRQEKAINQLNTDFKTFIHATGGDTTSRRRFWTDYLGPARQSIFTPAATFKTRRTQLFEPNLLATEALEKSARKENISVQAIFFAAVARTLAAAKNDKSPAVRCDTVVLGVWLANRSLDIDGLSELVAPTFNIVPLKDDVSKPLLESARALQKDLHNISEVDNCGISLRDIYAWTGWRVDCYVNFLRLPGQDASDSDELVEDKQATRITHADGQAREKAQALFRENHVEVTSPIVHDAVKEDYLKWCLPALDVEAKISDQGQLVVGLFAPEDVDNEAGLHELMDGIKGVLAGVKDE